MVHWGVIAAALFGIVVYPFLAVGLHQLFASTERRDGYDRSDVEPPPAHEAYPNRTIPGKRRGD